MFLCCQINSYTLKKWFKVHVYIHHVKVYILLRLQYYSWMDEQLGKEKLKIYVHLHSSDVVVAGRFFKWKKTITLIVLCLSRFMYPTSNKVIWDLRGCEMQQIMRLYRKQYQKKTPLRNFGKFVGVTTL